MKHSFNKYVAEKYGIEESILYENICYWCEKNHANKQNIHNGVSWTYNTYEAFEELFPYIKPSRIKRALRKLKEVNLIDIRNDLSENKWDKTNWYSIVKNNNIRCEQKETLDSDKNEPSIDNKINDHYKEQIINTNINTNIKLISEHFNVLWLLYPRQRRTEGKKKVKTSVKEKLLNISKEEWLRILDRYKKDRKDYKYFKECFRFMNNEVFEHYQDSNYTDQQQEEDDVVW